MENPFVKNGLMYGVVAIIVTLSLYLISPSNLASFWLMPVMLLILVVFMVKAIRDFKAANGGYASFGEALIQSFGTALVGAVLSSIFTYVLYNIIDPGLSDVIMQSLVEKFEGMEGFMGEEAVDAMIEGLEEQDMTMGISKILQGLVMGSIWYLIIALIVSAITKKNRPEGGSLDGNV